MAVLKFPPVQTADENGLLALGGDLEVSTLVLAYRSGIFPWPISHEFPLAWFSPDPRGVLDYADLNINKRLMRYIKSAPFTFKANHNFKAVIEHCGQVPRSDQSGTWITEEVKESYEQLFGEGLAYCLEAYEKNQLVGGIYGVCIDGIITGESMFHLVPNASKLCLIALMVLLKRSGIHWLDTQMVTPVVKSLGGKEIPREDFLKRIKNAPLRSREDIFPKNLDESLLRDF
jgi:leucyl/phenylalanyl-tRNA--protein transferase